MTEIIVLKTTVFHFRSFGLFHKYLTTAAICPFKGHREAVCAWRSISQECFKREKNLQEWVTEAYQSHIFIWTFQNYFTMQ